jgi:hypothetical protein
VMTVPASSRVTATRPTIELGSTRIMTMGTRHRLVRYGDGSGDRPRR